MKEVFVTRNPAEAHLVRGLLENAGIKAEVRNDPALPILGDMPVGSESPPAVWVPDDEKERAAAIIEDWRRAEPEAPPWECPKCGERIGGRFTACWECGTERA